MPHDEGRMLVTPGRPTVAGRAPDVEFVTTTVGKYLRSQRAGQGSRYARLMSKHLSAGKVLAGPKGIAVVRGLADAVEQEMAKTLRRVDGLLLYRGLRLLSRRMWIIDRYDDAGADARKVAEIAAQKYAAWPQAPADPGSRHFLWTKADAQTVGYLLLLAEAHLMAMTSHRRLAKGQVLVVDDPIGGKLRPKGDSDYELDRLMRIRDFRSMGSDDGLAGAGMHSQGNRGDDEAQILVAEWRPVAELEVDLEALVEVDVNRFAPAHDLLAAWGWRASIG